MAAQMAQKQKSCTTKSPLMEDWVLRLGFPEKNALRKIRISGDVLRTQLTGNSPINVYMRVFSY